MPANYDKIAKWYDFISHLVFRNALVDAQVWLLQYVPANSRILIVGGGTGWILEKIMDVYPEGLTIDYVESSAQMIVLSQKRNYKGNTVHFINVAVEQYSTNEKYEIILTPFLFDNFKAEKIQLIFTQLNAILKPSAIWLYADFVYDEQKSKWWQRRLLKLMYFFFRVTSSIETQELISMDLFFKTSGYTPINETARFYGFIKSIAYRKE